MVYRTLPLGFKSSAYIYHNLGMVATGYCRQLGVPISQYIDDRLISELETSYYDRNQGSRKAELALYIVCQVFTRLGYWSKKIFDGTNKTFLSPFLPNT